jgi:hypothetical protein
LEEWADAITSWQWFVLQHEEAPQQKNTQRQRSFTKQAKPHYKVLQPTPQPVSVSTEAEEAQKTVGGSREAAGADPEEVEAMDLD